MSIQELFLFCNMSFAAGSSVESVGCAPLADCDLLRYKRKFIPVHEYGIVILPKVKRLCPDIDTRSADRLEEGMDIPALRIRVLEGYIGSGSTTFLLWHTHICG